MDLAILLLALLTFQTATVIDVYTDSQVTLALQMGNVIYTAEFSKSELKPDSIHEGDQVKAAVRHGRMTVQVLLNGGSFTACNEQAPQGESLELPGKLLRQELGEKVIIVGL